MSEVSKLSEMQLSALAEVGNIGSGHAAIALSQLIGRKIMVAVTKVRITTIFEFSGIIGGGDTLINSVYIRALGDVQGAILLVFRRDNALRLADVLMNYKIGTTKILDEIEQSAIKEAGSILSASYLNALSELLRFSIIPSVPTMIIDRADKVFEAIYNDLFSKSEFLIGIETEFIEASTRIKGHFLFIPEQGGLEVLFKALNV